MIEEWCYTRNGGRGSPCYWDGIALYIYVERHLEQAKVEQAFVHPSFMATVGVHLHLTSLGSAKLTTIHLSLIKSHKSIAKSRWFRFRLDVMELLTRLETCEPIPAPSHIPQAVSILQLLGFIALDMDNNLVP